MTPSGGNEARVDPWLPAAKSVNGKGQGIEQDGGQRGGVNGGGQAGQQPVQRVGQVGRGGRHGAGAAGGHI
jgi:hypothetical protein